jgi:hypothetical protein
MCLRMLQLFILASLSYGSQPSMTEAELKQKTLDAFNRYIRATETRLDGQNSSNNFLWVDESPDRRRRAREGQVVIEPWAGKGIVEVPDGLVHDWVGAVFVPGATLEKTLAFVQNYDNHKNIYQEVIDSRTLQHEDNRYRIYLRFLKKKVVTVVLNTEHDVRYYPVDHTRWRSRSYSTRIAEVEDPGSPNERERPVGNDHGFLWRLYSYWRFQERDGGVYIECEAISLTRDAPTGFGWLIRPIIRGLPRESLANTLESTRTTLTK